VSTPLVSSVRIERIQCWLLRIPTIRAHQLAVATMREQRIVILELTDSDGRTGVGEATTIGGLAYADESPESIRLTIDIYLRPYLERVQLDPPAIMAAINTGIVGNYFAKCAVETALYDLLGRVENRSLADYFGGRKSGMLRCAWTLASGDTDSDIAEARAMLDTRRHRDFKLKIGKRSWQQDCAHVAAIADAVRGEASVRVDVNQAWDFDTARLAIPTLHEAGVVMVEQPLPAHDLAGARALCELNSAVILADEALRGGVHPARRLVADGAAQAFSLKIAQAGGLTGCAEVADIAQTAGLDLYGGTMLEGGVGTVAAAQIFATMHEFIWGTELFGPLLLTHDILVEPLRYAEFALHLPDGPGLGIAINPDAIAEFAEQ
jgi:muconate cycloisomerase